jgi:probable F420-dependent oxidoreductase
MKFGVCIPNYGDTLSVEGMRTVALVAAERGYDSIWTTDHILMPPQSGTPYERIFESITSLAYLAPLTGKVRLGISSLIMTMRNPAVVVKQLATLDQLSGGRVMLATSAGWAEKEFSHLGSDFHDRGKRLDESIKLIRALWSKGASGKFEGKRIPHKFDNVMFEPRPIQDKLTIWIGGNSKAAMKRAVSLGDAWHPNVYPLGKFRELVADFRKLPGGKEKPICVRIALNMKAKQSEYTNKQGERRLILSGNKEENENTISELENLGVSHIIVATNHDGKSQIQDQVESLRAFAKAVIK